MNKSIIERLTAPRLPQRIWKKFLSTFYYFPDQWVLLIARADGRKALSWADFRTILPPPDRDWADPFILVREGNYFLFIEEKPYSTNRGRIVCLSLNQKMEIQSAQVALERPYHLSYPFLFERRGQLFMIPESEKSNQVELYRCVRFPDQWEFEKPLIKNIKAVDSTIVEHNGKWWLFANVIEPGGTSWDTLNLYYSDDPISDRWTPHPLNPIVKNIHTARPAGYIQKTAEGLMRPSQDCSVRYGYATNFNRIIKMTETEYAETTESTYKPPRHGPFVGVHTWNQERGLVAIDAIFRRRRAASLPSLFPGGFVQYSGN
jgi:hypothetical protein